MGNLLKDDNFFLKLFLNGTLEHWNVSLVALAALRFDLFHTPVTFLVTCPDAKNRRPIPFDRSTVAYFDSTAQLLLKKTGIK